MRASVPSSPRVQDNTDSEPTSPAETFGHHVPSTPTTPTKSDDGEFTEYVVTRWAQQTVLRYIAELHVFRWYRAPEVMLVSGRYGTEIDVWSVGCVFGEMLIKKPLFPGNNYLDQLKLITRMLGRPTAADLDFVRKERAKSYMLSLPSSNGTKFQEKFRVRDSHSQLLEFVTISHV
jgi:serine/threonine protein kinase